MALFANECAVTFPCCLFQVGYYHAYVDGVDYVFLDHPCFKRGNDLYGGSRTELMFRCALLSKVRGVRGGLVMGGQKGGRVSGPGFRLLVAAAPS